MTRLAKPPTAMSIDGELADLRIARYSSPIARLRVGRLLRLRWAGRSLRDEGRELSHARDEEAAYARLAER